MEVSLNFMTQPRIEPCPSVHSPVTILSELPRLRTCEYLFKTSALPSRAGLGIKIYSGRDGG